jgi:hypothetical protein
MHLRKLLTPYPPRRRVGVSGRPSGPRSTRQSSRDHLGGASNTAQPDTLLLEGLGSQGQSKSFSSWRACSARACESKATAPASRHTVARMVKSKEARVSALASCETSTMRYETHHDYSRSAMTSQPASAARLAFLLPAIRRACLGGLRLIHNGVDGCFARLLTLNTTACSARTNNGSQRYGVPEPTGIMMNRNLGDSG